MKITYNTGRCYFNEFNEINDLDTTNQTSGLSYYQCNIIGAIASLIGLSNKIEYVVGKQIKCVYVVANDLKKWSTRHISNDTGLNIEFVKKALFEKKFTEVIQEICQNFTRNQDKNFENDINSKKLITKAEIELDNNDLRDSILKNITSFLKKSYDKKEGDHLKKTIFYTRVVPQIGHTWDAENAALDFLKKNEVSCHCLKTIYLR